MLFNLADAGGVGRRGCFVVWIFQLALLDDSVGVWLLLTAIIDCKGSVFVAMFFVLDSLVMGNISVLEVLFGLEMFDFIVTCRFPWYWDVRWSSDVRFLVVYLLLEVLVSCRIVGA